MAALALGKERVVEGHALGVELARARGEDAGPRYGDADAVHAKALAKLQVNGVAVVEVRGRVGREAPLGGEKIVPGHAALAVRAGLALDLVGRGRAAVNESLGELPGHDGSFL